MCGLEAFVNVELQAGLGELAYKWLAIRSGKRVHHQCLLASPSKIEDW
jgi:hypothetical protein